MAYRPNEIDIFVRVLYSSTALFLLIYGGYGVYVNDLVLFGKRGAVLHFSDKPLWIMSASMICGALACGSVVVDHYDKRNNEYHYKVFAKVLEYMAWTLFVTASVTWIYST